ncbi:spore germination protein GerW family protein [Planococcus sp. ISL-110]|uniref:GerW family sporulation protein n=1 Tax=Planococcus sp. ISL-110 TaxID=2819167 RepID=UPI001BE52049|nr:spore germination protein GerW family protein [Planococcus sp. ISL-110]MBT2570068.1 hypothetical protein [Planococcus sp. ISL-110]
MTENAHVPFKLSPVRSISEKFSEARDVSLVYGDPIEIGDTVILPVAKVKYLIAAGGGEGYELKDTDRKHPGSEKTEGGSGEGSGGSFQIKPLGIYSITAEKTVYKPIIPLELILLLPLMITGLAFLMSPSQTKQKSRCMNKREKGQKMKKMHLHKAE